MKKPFRGLLLGIFVVVLIGTMLVFRQSGTKWAAARLEIPRESDSKPQTSITGAQRRQPSANARPSVLSGGTNAQLSIQAQGLAALEAADERGDLLGGLGTSTPEELLFDISVLRAEPFAPKVLNKLEAALGDLKSSGDRLRAAAILNRYGRKSGADYLRSLLKGTSDYEATVAATALVMSKDADSASTIAELMDHFLANPEFAKAIARSQNPVFMEKVHALVNEPALLRTAPKVLASAADGAGIELLKEALKSKHIIGPVRLPYEASLVRLGVARIEPFLEDLRNAQNQPALAGDFVIEALQILQPEQATPILREILASYAAQRRAFTAEYNAYENAVRSGTKSLREHPPAYPGSERMMLQAAAILTNQQDPLSTELLYNVLEAAQGALYKTPMNRELISDLAQVDPRNSHLRLSQMEFSESDIDAGFALARLAPIPYSLRPEQRSIALSKRASPDPLNCRDSLKMSPCELVKNVPIWPLLR